MLKTRLGVAILGILLPMTVCAWDLERAQPAPELLGWLPAAVKISTVTVTIGPESTEVRYLLQNASPNTAHFELGSATTISGAAGLLDDYPNTGFLDLVISLNGASLAPRKRLFAILNGEDVTKQLRRKQIDPLRPLTETNYSAKVSPRAFSELTQQGLFAPTQEGGWPLWQTVISRGWGVSLPPLSSSTFAIRYKPRPERRSVDIEDLEYESIVSKHCTRPEELRNLIRKPRSSGTEVKARRWEIPVRLANSGVVKVDVIASLGGAGLKSEKFQKILALGCDAQNRGQISDDGNLRISTSTDASVSILTLESVD